MAPNFICLDGWEANTFHNVIPSNTLARHCPLDNGRHTLNFDNSKAPRLGTLERLPAELQLQVILALDIASLLVWMRVNKRAMDFVWGLVEWKTATCPADPLRMAIGLGTHTTLTLPSLITALSTEECANCTNPARYTDMSTPSLYRLCRSCFRAIKNAKQAVRDAVCKEWERLKQSQNEKYALLWNEFSRKELGLNAYESKLRLLKAEVNEELKEARRNMNKGEVRVWMEEALGCVKDKRSYGR